MALSDGFDIAFGLVLNGPRSISGLDPVVGRREIDSVTGFVPE